jgi:hypothetical protein
MCRVPPLGPNWVDAPELQAFPHGFIWVEEEEELESCEVAVPMEHATAMMIVLSCRHNEDW